jgi:DmsE family decaheme c-type cytochrome
MSRQFEVKRLLGVALRCVALGLALSASSTLVAAGDDLLLKGDAKCTACHDDSDAPELLAIGKTRHGVQSDGRTPTCTSCHGESLAHLNHKGSGKPPQPDVNFSKKSKTTAEDRSAACMSCHQGDAKRSHWDGSVHQSRDVSCASCHQVHNGRDRVRDKKTQAEVCYTCHKEQRTQVNKPSHHPIPEGKMTCSDCHNAHGSVGPKLMKRDSVVDTCYTCHMEKRGPFVRSHEPVQDDCSTCHNPHGTTAESMLKMRAPFLCQSCHTPHAAIQPLLAGQAPAAGIAGWNGTTILQGRSCMNCHTQVHGSNNPSPTSPTPQFLFR